MFYGAKLLLCADIPATMILVLFTCFPANAFILVGALVKMYVKAVLTFAMRHVRKRCLKLFNI